MPKVIPFKAVRPTRDKVGLVACRPYQSYTQDQRESRLNYNPFSFLHIVNPGYKYHKEIAGKQRYQLVKNRYLEFREENIFIQDPQPYYYVYRIIDRERNSFTGIIAATSIEDYKANCIKCHEDTLTEREINFKEYIKTVGFNAEPVLLTHPRNKNLDNIIAEVTKDRPEYEFTTTYRDTHYLWIVKNATYIEKIENAYKEIPALYIADGHHRSASSALLAEDTTLEEKSSNKVNPYQYFMSFIIPEDDLKIHEFNRLITDLNGLSKEEFLIALDSYFIIENLKNEYFKPLEKNQFSMYLDKEFYRLTLKRFSYKFTDALSSLDAQVLYNTVLKPILNITDVRNNKRIAYAHGKKDLTYIKECVDSGDYKVGFGLKPIAVEEMKQIADEGLTMPPKTTYIEPKLRSGITIYEF
ncbi:uncharacterized protein (DUF1015 family) [Mesonia hippocampi]|uniref:Uncharacterized protein (DUF1015 family) n=1 Tax=Mesonia hippocampi TaxID=1628250 RepID=A0A840ENJ9_9FLAO|nr:DUF1015 domain-containing protein [Mesonia hippocampi]MBB4119698.1 uncharacterized protein (DUF1015 family) [Mesonia hippocampi]